ncbi:MULTISPECIES: phosphonopyruvate decarboxylase [unclassified Sphaerochaeta]|jgi:phosphonopyruvate decarboxylase|uniref:phosphonopyruvate decarboxylase n=1 Tax=unclassified Sphaerochaeta TaxID=2637943 RepID=UPI0025F8E9B4|nr:phosphonopyruvate decarboxylase [Sphaerochaeta sp. UBA5856]
MINPSSFLTYLEEIHIDFFAGVPDSQLKNVCEELYHRYGCNTKKHIVAVNEGNAVGMAAGYHLATGNIPLVYLQNSGLGNAVNPQTSLIDPEVYGIPIVYLVGWRGEPGVHDEPQHIKQGAITTDLLNTLGVAYEIIGKDSTLEQIQQVFEKRFLPLLAQGKSVAFIVRKGAFSSSNVSIQGNENTLGREEVIRYLASNMSVNDYVVSTTGKISRELFEYCKNDKPEQSSHNFLTVGSMGHASAIASTIALYHPDKTVWCLDGDGAVLMHMGSLCTIGTLHPQNLIHIVLNNEAHESVGAMPTVAGKVNLVATAIDCGYASARKIKNFEELVSMQIDLMPKPCLIEVMVSTGSREDLIRPDTTPQQNKMAFMEALQV